MRRGILAGALLVLGAFGVSGCGKAKTPEEAHGKLCRAVSSGDPAALFEALDQPARWAWMTVQKSHREAYDIILSNYPEGVDRDRQLRRFERGATLGSGRALFVEEVGKAALPTLGGTCGAGARIEKEADGHQAVAMGASGARARLVLDPKGSWGFAGFDEESEDRQKRALADVAQVRLNAADYERAAARAGK